jgi:hypothetical protein
MPASWAVATVMSRQNKIPVGGTNEVPVFSLALIPIWDLFNHRRGKVCVRVCVSE